MRRLVHGTLVAVLSAGVLAGCGDDDPPAPSTSPSGSPTATTSSPSESATPTDEPSATVEAASGPEKTLGNITLNFPAGYDVRELTSSVLTASGPEGEFMSLLAHEAVSQTPLSRLARDMLGDPVFSGKPVRLDDVVADGVRMYHVSGPDGAGRTRDVIGVEHGGYGVQLEFRTALPEAGRQELIESVLASVRWS